MAQKGQAPPEDWSVGRLPYAPPTPVHCWGKAEAAVFGVTGLNDTRNPAAKAQASVRESAKTVEKHSEKIAESAQELRSSSAAIEGSAEQTTRLAADRNVLAAERTYAAWVRTGLFALASGVGTRALLTGLVPEWLILANASVLIAFSVFVLEQPFGVKLIPGGRHRCPTCHVYRLSS